MYSNSKPFSLGISSTQGWIYGGGQGKSVFSLSKKKVTEIGKERAGGREKTNRKKFPWINNVDTLINIEINTFIQPKTKKVSIYLRLEKSTVGSYFQTV